MSRKKEKHTLFDRLLAMPEKNRMKYLRGRVPFQHVPRILKIIKEHQELDIEKKEIRHMVALLDILEKTNG